MIGLLHLSGCDSRPASPAAKTPTIASLVPAGTDLLLTMGAGDHLVAVSIYDSNPSVTQLPRAGDYQTADWELLTNLKPRYMAIQMNKDRIPDGFKQRAAGLGIEFLNLRLDTLDDIFGSIEELGDKTGESAKAVACKAKLRSQLDAIRQRVAHEPPVRTLLVIDPDGHGLAGGGTYLDELLQIAGGQNVAANLTARYPSADPEQLQALHPDAIIQLLPAATPQVEQAAANVWKRMPELPAVKNGRVYILTNPYGLVPGGHVGDVAEEFAAKLHPAANGPAIQPATRPATLSNGAQ